MRTEPLEAAPVALRSGGVFVGRLAADGDLRTLLEALDLYAGARIELIGVGPARSQLESHRCLNVRGRLAPAAVRERMRRALYLVLPAPAYGRVPQVLVEAFGNGVAVIASRQPALAEWVEPGRNGLLFEPGSARELARRLAWADAFPEKMLQMGQCARADYEARLASALPSAAAGKATTAAQNDA